MQLHLDERRQLVERELAARYSASRVHTQEQVQFCMYEARPNFCMVPQINTEWILIDGAFKHKASSIQPQRGWYHPRSSEEQGRATSRHLTRSTMRRACSMYAGSFERPCASTLMSTTLTHCFTVQSNKHPTKQAPTPSKEEKGAQI